MLVRAPLAMKTLHKKLILLYCSSSSDSREIAAWQGHFDGSGMKAQACVSVKCSRGSHNASRRAQTAALKRVEPEEKTHSGPTAVIKPIKLEAICAWCLLAKVVLFWENMPPNDCFAAGDTNPYWWVVFVPLCLSGYNLASCVYGPCIYIYILIIYLSFYHFAPFKLLNASVNVVHTQIS